RGLDVLTLQVVAFTDGRFEVLITVGPECQHVLLKLLSSRNERGDKLMDLLALRTELTLVHRGLIGELCVILARHGTFGNERCGRLGKVAVACGLGRVFRKKGLTC